MGYSVQRSSSSSSLPIYLADSIVRSAELDIDTVEVQIYAPVRVSLLHSPACYLDENTTLSVALSSAIEPKSQWGWGCGGRQWNTTSEIVTCPCTALGKGGETQSLELFAKTGDIVLPLGTLDNTV